MREILFRGMTIREKWVYGNLIKTDKGYLINHSLDFATKVSPNDKYAFALFEDEISAVAKNTIGQYTGLKDKNGKMIFEGDIIAGDGEDMPNRIVEWSNDSLEYFVGLGQDVWQSPLYDVVLPEVIGNIFDNLNLLTIKTNI